MNKILFWIKNILFVLLTVLIIIASFRFKYVNIIYVALYVLFMIINLRDIIRKDKINKDILYNTISVLSLFIMSFVFLRVLYDPGFLHNSDIIKAYINTTIFLDDDFIYEAITFIEQNMVLFIVLLSLLIGYKFMNTTKMKKEYFSASLILMIISILSIIPSIYTITLINAKPYYFDATFSACYLFVILILVGIEIFRFIQGKYKDKIWMLWTSLSLNLFGIVVCAIQMHYTFKYWL